NCSQSPATERRHGSQRPPRPDRCVRARRPRARGRARLRGAPRPLRPLSRRAGIPLRGRRRARLRHGGARPPPRAARAAPPGDAALVIDKLRPAAAGRTYEAWISTGGAPEPAGLFGGGEVVTVPLERPVHRGASVLVTEERAGGVDAPTQAPFLSVKDSDQS